MPNASSWVVSRPSSTRCDDTQPWKFHSGFGSEDWTPIFTNRAPFVFEVLQSLNYSNRFYRAVPAH